MLFDRISLQYAGRYALSRRHAKILCVQTSRILTKLLVHTLPPTRAIVFDQPNDATGAQSPYA